MGRVSRLTSKWLTRRPHAPASSDPQPQPEAQKAAELLADFIRSCEAIPAPRVLELGVKRADPQRSTRRQEWVPHAGEYIGTDLEPGQDVDLVADVHRLTAVVGEEQFDAIISCSTFEHFKYPHLAAHELMKALKIGGRLFIQTHQTFPIHSYPQDYFRFSQEALAGLFGTKMGFRVIATCYEFPALITSQRVPELAGSTAFLNTCLHGEKIGKTPAEYIFEFEV